MSTSPAVHSQIRDEQLIRKTALHYFGHQGIQDLAVLGAILGNNIREIGRYKVTCDGPLVQGQYTIYELIHFGILFATGRTKSRCTRRRRRHRHSHCHCQKDCQKSNDSNRALEEQQQSQLDQVNEEDIDDTDDTEEQDTAPIDGTDSNNSTNSSPTNAIRIYPTLLANLFPAVVFKALRKKSRVLPRLSEENSDDDEENNIVSNQQHSSSSMISMSLPRHIRRRSNSYSGEYSSSSSSFFSISRSNNTNNNSNTNAGTFSAAQDPFLVSTGSVVTLLIKNRLHRVKDLPMPRELCFMGAVSLPLPPSLRAMHVAWTMDFLSHKVTSPRRQRRHQRQQEMKEVEGSTTRQGVDDQQQQQANTNAAIRQGGLEFRQEIYAHKMAIARTIRAQQLKHRQQLEQKQKLQMRMKQDQQQQVSQSWGTVPIPSHPQQQQQQRRLSLSMVRGHAFKIPEQIKEENEEEDDDEEDVSSACSQSPTARVTSTATAPASASGDVSALAPAPIGSMFSPSAAAATSSLSATSTSASNTTTATATAPIATRSTIRQSKRLMQQILSLENKIPRSVRKWAAVARTCFSPELVAEDRLLQEWVDKQRIQVVLACGGTPPPPLFLCQGMLGTMKQSLPIPSYPHSNYKQLQSNNGGGGN
ncbi:hypothetical protein BG004_003471, partial [Podila humilis]